MSSAIMSTCEPLVGVVGELLPSPLAGKGVVLAGDALLSRANSSLPSPCACLVPFDWSLGALDVLPLVVSMVFILEEPWSLFGKRSISMSVASIGC